jgi:signal transduction histidine kinase
MTGLPDEPDIRVNPSAEKSEAQIRELVERLEAFRNDRHGDRQATARSFRWETGVDGAILWVEGAPREALVGQTIASPAALGAFGVDGQAAGAFKRRAAFRDARLSVAGAGGAAGEWRISGVPFFDSRQGHFLGYRGSARRPRIDESAAPLPASEHGLFGTELHPDSLRQLIHELRTPLNAILGFAEMIDGQYLGPAADSYRARAGAIREEAARLLSAVDDLDTAARIETSRFPVEESSVDLAAMLHRLHGDYGRVATARRALLRLDFESGLPLAACEPASAERMIARMLAATIGLAGEREVLSASMSEEESDGRKLLCLSITRPKAIQGRSEDELLDPGYTPEGDWPEAPALGLGFALRLVRNLAETVGGRLVIGADCFFLSVPAVDASGR